MNVTFNNVGRDKKTFSVKLKSLTDSAMRKAVREHGGIRSRYPDFEMIDDNNGLVLAGFRTVGEFTVDGG
jgi:hypothetical protein